LNIFEKLSEVVNSAEDSVINLLCVIAPWLVPIIPAYLTYWHTVKNLQFPDWVAWTAAIVVEVLGLASMRTSISFFEHNKRYSKETNKAPVSLSMATYVFYLVVILTVNVLLDATNGVRWENIVAIGLFSLLSVPAGILISVRTQHSELLKELARTRYERRMNKPEPAERSRTVHEPERERPSQHEQAIYSLLEQTYKLEQRIPGATEIATKLNLDPYHSKGYISERTKSWKESKGLLQ
jgi:hypothetical protein